MEIISAAMGIGEYLKNAVAIICVWSVIGVMIFDMGTYVYVEGGSRCLTYVGKALTGVHLPRRRGPAESVLDCGIEEFCNH